MQCTWYAGDRALATGPESYTAYESYAAARDATVGFSTPDIIWGSVPASLNEDGSAPYVDIQHSLLGFEKYKWKIGIVGNFDADHASGFISFDEALASAQLSSFLPAGFCTERFLPPLNCDTAKLLEDARCFRCIPKGMIKEVMIYLLCQWANEEGPPPEPPVECGAESDIIQIVGAGTAAANQYYTWDDDLSAWVGNVNSGYTISLVDGVWTMIFDLQVLYTATDVQFPCLWTTVGGGNPAPTGLYITIAGIPAIYASQLNRNDYHNVSGNAFSGQKIRNTSAVPMKITKVTLWVYNPSGVNQTARAFVNTGGIHTNPTYGGPSDIVSVNVGYDQVTDFTWSTNFPIIPPNTDFWIGFASPGIVGARSQTQAGGTAYLDNVYHMDNSDDPLGPTWANHDKYFVLWAAV